jgi:protocatechuate 3,4-dioxygenase beta subunit
MTEPGRRHALAKLGALALTPWLPGHALAQERTPTPPLTEGPFYPRAFPADRDADLTRVAGKAGTAAGTPLEFSGRLLDRRGRPLAGRAIEIWHCDEFGQYHLIGEPEGAGDAAFQGWGEAAADSEGRFAFRTIKPPPYPGRTPHIHFTVRDGRRRVLTSQAFFEGERANERDFLYRSLGSGARLVTMRLESAGKGLRGALHVVLGI